MIIYSNLMILIFDYIEKLDEINIKQNEEI
jgi:hypothetical protein